MQRQRHPVVLGQLVHRRALGGDDPVLGDAVAAGLVDHRRVVRVEQQVELGFVEVMLVRHRGGGGDAVDVVEEQPDVAQPPHAGLGTDGGQADLDPRVAERALLGLAGAVVEVHLLVRAAGDAHPPAPALVLVDEHDAVLGALVHRPRRARRHARRVEAVLADARQEEHERLLVGEAHRVLGLAPQPLHDGVPRAVLRGAAEVVVPVRAPLDRHRLAGEQRLRLGDGEVVAERGVGELLVVVGPRLVVVADVGQHRVGEDREELLEPATGLQREPAAPVAHPAALPLLLVLVAPRVALPGAGLDVVEPHVLDAAAVGPRLLAGDRAGVAADALVEVHDHAHLGHHAHL